MAPRDISSPFFRFFGEKVLMREIQLDQKCSDTIDAELRKSAREMEKGLFESSTWEINKRIWG